MAFKLIESAQHRWRASNSAHLVALVRAGSKFENGGVVVEQHTNQQAVTPTPHDTLIHRRLTIPLGACGNSPDGHL
jgi:hypothetical protein